MTTLFGFFRRRLFGIAVREIRFSRRGFSGATEDFRARVEQVGLAFIGGYHSALVCGRPETITSSLDRIDAELRGFAFEGAGMGFALLDRLSPGRATRLNRFLTGPGQAHVYMIHVGAGWLGPRMPAGFRRLLPRLDPLLRWLAFDGWGFHEGFFHWPKYILGQPQPEPLAGYERRAFDQGLGRSFWFVNGGNVELIAQTIASFSVDRQPDLWSGIGLGATYAGIIGESSLAELCCSAGAFRPQLAQGAAFAAKARERAGNMAGYTDLAAGALCGMSALDAARLCDQTLENLPANAGEPAFEIWRRRIQIHFGRSLKLQVI